MDNRTCELPGCDTVHYGRGFCRLHYRRLMKHGSPLWTPPKKGDPCSIEGCEGKTQARRLCGSHYQKLKKYGDPSEDRRRQRRFCEIDGCCRKVQGYGWCSKHYNRWREHGDPNWEPAIYAECTADGCDKATARGRRTLCEAHYMRLRRRGTLEAGCCTECGQALPRDSTASRRFCDDCNLALRRKRGIDYFKKRRAARLGGPSELIISRDIYERDGWKCGLCGRKVNPKLSWPDRRSASLDHIVPLSQGGHHVRTNVQLAHLGCNNSKGARGGGEQLMLIG